MPFYGKQGRVVLLITIPLMNPGDPMQVIPILDMIHLPMQ